MAKKESNAKARGREFTRFTIHPPFFDLSGNLHLNTLRVKRDLLQFRTGKYPAVGSSTAEKAWTARNWARTVGARAHSARQTRNAFVNVCSIWTYTRSSVLRSIWAYSGDGSLFAARFRRMASLFIGPERGRSIRMDN